MNQLSGQPLEVRSFRFLRVRRTLGGTPLRQGFSTPGNLRVFNGHLLSTNRIRSSIEMLLSYLRVKKVDVSSGKVVAGKRVAGKRTPISLHNRINLLKAKKPDVADRLSAIKWIGNADSHNDSISSDDVLDGFDILDYVLEELFIGRHQQVSVLVEEINKAKGPRRGTSHKLS